MLKIEIPYAKNTNEYFYIKKNNAFKLLEPEISKIEDNNVDEESIINFSMEKPIESLKLEELIKFDSKIAIIVDDITRPTPTHKILPILLKRIKNIQTDFKKITIIIANGSHRKHSLEEKIKLLGRKVLEEIKVVDHDAYNDEDLISIGKTKRGTPIKVNKDVVNSDVRILIGLIKPHIDAGYSGGGKSILPGVCGIETIMHNHSFDAVNSPYTRAGVIEGNPIRDDIEEASSKLRPNFILNVILNNKLKIIHAVAGDIIKAHREGIIFIEKIVKVKVNKRYDGAIIGCSYPHNLDFVQSLGVLSIVHRIPNPVVKKNGVLVLISACSEGFGSVCIENFIKKNPNPHKMLEIISKQNYFMDGQWCVQVLAEILMKYKVIIVTEGLDPKDIIAMGAIYKPTAQQAINYLLKELGEDREFIILPEAAYTLPVLEY